MSCFKITVFYTIFFLSLPVTAWAQGGEAGIVLLPDSFTLHGANAEQRVLVLQSVDGTFVGELTSDITWQSSDPNVVGTDTGYVYPVGNGQAVVTAGWHGQLVTANVKVEGMGEPAVPSFRNDILAVFAKLNCNSGACHGALAGKGEFKLSLRGYDPLADYAAVAVQASGRRIELSDPGRSLILAKPSGAIAHKGGLRFEVGSPAYKVISHWVAQGAPMPQAGDPVVERIKVFPAGILLQPGDEISLIVHAHYSNGQVQDVTRWSKFESADLSVAHVNDSGRVKIIGPGEGAVTAWYASKIAIARTTVPFTNKVNGKPLVDFESHNFIDDLVLAKLTQLNLTPSPPANDATFLRRAFLDTLGLLPTPDEVRSFLADTSPLKRQKLIDALLARPEFVDYWSYKWSDLLLVNGRLLRQEPVKAYYQWIRTHVEQNTPWDKFVQEVVTAQGETLANGATNFYSLHQDAETMTENVCQAFLGLSLGCAKCHNHPLEKWTNDQYYGMASFFARVRGKGWGGDTLSGDGLRTVLVADSGELLQPRTGLPQPPTPLDGEPLPGEETGDRRQYLARWLTAPENPYFSRAISNRIWANFFHIGLVEAVDDLRDTNPASNEPLLAELADFLVERDFDLKQLMREILISSTYGLSSTPHPGNIDDTRFYSRYHPQRLMAEVLLDAISQVLAVPTEFTQIVHHNGSKEETKFYPKGTRAIQLYDAAVASDFLKSFGRNPRYITCECERSDEPSMMQALHISNGAAMNSKLKQAGNRVDQLLEADQPAYKLIEEIYLASLARYPSDSEIRKLLPLIADAENASRREVVEDLFWSVLSSRQFLFNH